MNWRSRPLASHEVIVSTIAATTTRTGLRVHAGLDTGTCPTGTRISDAQLDALALRRHHWHGDWNYTLAPRAPAPPNRAARRPGRIRPDLAWLCHPALTGMPATHLDALTAALTAPSGQLREARLNRRRGYRPRQTAPGTGRRPILTLTGKLLAAILCDRHGMPQTAIAALYHAGYHTINKHISAIRHLLHQTGHTIQPSPHQLVTLDDLCQYATEKGITIPANIKTAS